jgi:hypothetical protein
MLGQFRVVGFVGTLGLLALTVVGTAMAFKFADHAGTKIVDYCRMPRSRRGAG